ncbi:hypothetical protein V5799_031237 [Amblyomma americanum]|uniref:Secreted protein n=1 Tax=Amblyomma americanum TaxID=6943 RepID=A0AAQ4EL21_AMBAM
MQHSRRILAIALVALLVAAVAVQEARAIHHLKHKKIAKLLIIAKALHPKVIPIIPFHITKHSKIPVHYPAYYAVQSHSAYKHVILPESHGYGGGHGGGGGHVSGGAHFLGGGGGGGHGWW